MAAFVYWFILLCWIHLSAAEDVNITDGATLLQYLCPGKGIGTLPPNTNLVLSEPQLNLPSKLGDELCLIENTTNLTISPSQDVFDNGYQYVKVVCCNAQLLGNLIGFGFFNVTNLTMSSVVFIGCGAIITADAVKFVNETQQYFIL